MNQALAESKVEVCKKQEMIDNQKRSFAEKKRELEVMIQGLEAKNRCLEKPSPFVEMYKKSEKRRRQEVAELTKEIQELRVISKDQEQNINSLKEVSEVLRAADLLQAERNLKVWKQSFEIGVIE